MEDAHEPRAGQIANRDGSERILVEVRQLEDPEATVRQFEELCEGRWSIRTRRDGNEIRPDGLDHVGQLSDRPDNAIVLRMRVVHDADHGEAAVAAKPKLAFDGHTGGARTDDENAAARTEPPTGPILPSRDQGKHGQGGKRQPHEAEVERRYPCSENR